MCHDLYASLKFLSNFLDYLLDCSRSLDFCHFTSLSEHFRRGDYRLLNYKCSKTPNACPLSPPRGRMTREVFHFSIAGPQSAARRFYPLLPRQLPYSILSSHSPWLETKGGRCNGVPEAFKATRLPIVFVCHSIMIGTRTGTPGKKITMLTGGHVFVCYVEAKFSPGTR